MDDATLGILRVGTAWATRLFFLPRSGDPTRESWLLSTTRLGDSQAKTHGQISRVTKPKLIIKYIKLIFYFIFNFPAHSEFSFWKLSCRRRSTGSSKFGRFACFIRFSHAKKIIKSKLLTPRTWNYYPFYQNESIVLQYLQLGVTFGADMQPEVLAATFMSNFW